MSMTLRYTARSDLGLVRTNNEDSVYAGARLLALADGMGGHAAGEVASQLVIAALAHLDDDEPGGDLLGKLDAGIQEGNSAIASYVQSNPELEGMGTTLTAILFAGNRLGLAHVGDSRGYLLRDGELTQITRDDTFVQTLVDEGRITAEEAHSHPQRSLIMRALTGHEVEPTLTMREAQVGDRYLLCSDGLSDPVTDETIREALQIPDIEASALRLIELALRGGGPDNVTVVVADVVDDEHDGQTQPILAGAVSGHDESLNLTDSAAGRASAITRSKAVAERVLPKVAPTALRPRSRRRLLAAAVLLALLIAAALFIGRIWTRTYYYVSAYQGTVSIMRGVQGSILGFRLQDPYQLGCLNSHGELVQVSYGQSAKAMGCQPLTLQDLRPPARQQVSNGLPVGSLDDAIKQLHNLVKDSLLPPCPAGAPGPGNRPPAQGAAPAPPPAQTAAPAPANGVPHLPTATNLAPAPPEPGTECRAAA
ncbi:MAG TPA: PP2C family serine/threonine-protein phosphatase [Mycobacterium sp.]|nr:PP2C family serine/threonine-protein phosphatase [Mycobacterium sp.]